MTEREVVVNLETCASKVGGSGPSNKLQDSHEKSKVQLAQNRKEDVLQNQQNLQQYSSLSRENSLRSPSNASVQRNSRKWAMGRTKSRLIDLPEESCVDSLELQETENDEDDIEDMPKVHKSMMISACTILQLVCLASIVAALVCNLCFSHLKRLKLLDLHLWEWEVMILVLICGRLLSCWATNVIVFLMERNFILRKRVLYFIYGVKSSVTNCFWLGLVLLVWHFILSKTVKDKVRDPNLVHVTKILLCLFVGTLIWLLKTILVKVFALCFHVKAFFERIREALFNQYVIETLSGPPLREHASHVDLGTLAYVRSWRLARKEGLHKNYSSVGKRCESLRLLSENNKKQDEEISLEQLHKLNKSNISAWNMKRMVNIIRHGAFTTLDEKILDSDIEDESMLQITTECQTKQAAMKIFQNVTRTGSRYISLEDVMRFMRKEEALKTMDLLREASGGQEISLSSLTDFMVNALRERKALAFSLKDTKTAVDELHNMLRFLVAIIILIVWLLILGTPILHLIVFISSQLLLAVFMFGNTCRMVFEAIIFLFIMHPFDVGDRCEVDGAQMMVEEMNILTTVFLKYDNQKIIYPNSVLATKPIINYQRSPDMGDAIDFCIHISTPLDKVAIMKRRITENIERKNEHWHPAPMVIMRDVEELNKLNMSVWLTHRINNQDIKERWCRRSELIEDMIKVFRELDIEYRMLPLDVNIRNLSPIHF
ncbi:hypothetical protein RIF29_13515 [Crotalaria pallida]|uniref:Mechanosensitive ion channel protein n=1 Tax=Crotalaria pallida TaxID=3830 RepID=A0AAN9IPH2_CROPI